MRYGFIALLALVFHSQVFAQKTLLVAIKPLTPFVMPSGSSFEGYSIDLWNTIALKNGWRSRYLYFNTVKEVLYAVSSNQADVGIAGISITTDREEIVDFSLPMFNSGLQVLVPMRPAFDPMTALRNLFSPQLGFVALMIVSSVLIAGHVMWLVMRHRPDYPKGYIGGVIEGIWWAAMSFPQNSLGEKNPASVVGRLAGMFWVIVSVVLLANFTASVTANLTVQQIQGGIRGVNDLPGKRVLAVSGTTSETYLAQNSIRFQTAPTIEDAVLKLEQGRADAVVYDAPVLQYQASHTGNGRLAVVGDVFKPEYYGIAVPLGSPKRKIINRTLTEMISNGELTQIQQHWFGGKP
jgi:polar amino acid transport system substrate-binding protein